jgi:cellulose biosynthesis protein BcsQ
MKEAPALSKSIFDHDPGGAASRDYLALCGEFLERLNRDQARGAEVSYV